MATIVDEKKLGIEVKAFVLVHLFPKNRVAINVFGENVKRSINTQYKSKKCGLIIVVGKEKRNVSLFVGNVLRGGNFE